MAQRKTHINAIITEIDWLFLERIEQNEVKEGDKIKHGAILNGTPQIFRVIDRRDRPSLYRVARQKAKLYLAEDSDNTFSLFKEVRIKRAKYLQSYFPDYATIKEQKKIYYDLEAWIEVLTNLKPIDKDTRYSVSLFYTEGFQKIYPYPSLKNQIDMHGFFGITVDGIETKVYTPELALVLVSDALKVTNCDSKMDEVIKGQMFVDTYLKGFQEGVGYFEKEYAVSPSTLYGANAPQYVKVIEENYFKTKIKAGKTGWISYKQTYPLLITHKSIQEYGYYSGILSSVDAMVKKHHSLFASFETPQKSEPKTKAKIEPTKKTEPKSFADLFGNKKWKKYVDALHKVDHPIIDKNYAFIGKPRRDKGVICSWFKDLQNDNIISKRFTRQEIASVLNNEIKDLNLGRDGKTFDLISTAYNEEYKESLYHLVK